MKLYEKDTSICFNIKNISHLIRRTVDSCIPEKTGITGMQGFIIGYIYESGGEIFQNELEKTFSIRRSSITGILQIMEKNGLITREYSALDARVKKIILTPKACEAHEKIVSSIARIDSLILSGISDGEKEIFLRVLNEIRQNLDSIQERC